MIQILKILLILASIFINFLLAFTVYLRDKKATTNIFFAIVSAMFGLWGTSLLFYEYPIILNSLFWLRSAYLSASIMEICIVGFSFIFPKPVLHKLWPFTAIYSTIFLAITIFLLFFTHLWIVGLHMVRFGIVEAKLGSIYLGWTVGEWGLIILSLLALFTNHQRVKGLEKTQLQYLLTGFFIFGFAVNFFDVIVPFSFHTTEFFGISSLLSIIFTGTVAYIILRHRFMDLHRTIRQVGYYTISILFLGTVYYGIAFLIGIIFFPKKFYVWYTAVVIGIILVVRYSTDSFRSNIGKRVKKLLIKGLYDREDVLRALTDLMTSTINLKTMVEKTLVVTYNTFLPEFVIGLSITEGHVVVWKMYAGNKQYPLQIPTRHIKVVGKVNTLMLADELSPGSLHDILLKHGISVVLPFHSGKWKRFMLLGNKQSGESYFSYDIDTFTLMQPILRLMGQHVRQVEEIRQFNHKLKQEINSATAKLKENNKRLKVADRLKDEFISIASHELKTPTTAIQGFLWLVLQKDKALSKYSREKIERVAKLTEHITMLVNDMLDVTKIESKRITLHPEAFTLCSLVEEIKGELDLIALGKNLKVTIVKTENCTVWADKQRTHQIVSNLLHNAIKYTPPGGTITIKIHKKKSFLSAAIADTGIGIRKKDISKLFTKFGKLEDGNSVSSHLPGSGLGLYITKNLVELSGGRIDVASAYRKGSTFTFTLPAAKNTASA